MSSYTTEEFEADVSKTINFLFTLAFRLSNDAEQAKDIVQSTLLLAWEKRGQLRAREFFLPWVRRICVNYFLQQARKREPSHFVSIEALSDSEDDKVGMSIASDQPTPEDEVVVAEAIRDVQDACYTAMAGYLTLPQRVVFALVDIFGLDVEEAASVVDVSVSAAKALLSRARRHLEIYFTNYCSLLIPNNSCTCASWRAFIDDRVALRAEVKRRGMEVDFGGKPKPFQPMPGIREKILGLFRTLPLRTPDPAWYSEVVRLLKSREN